MAPMNDHRNGETPAHKREIIVVGVINECALRISARRLLWIQARRVRCGRWPTPRCGSGPRPAR